jgi:hypothetical protein
MVLDRDSILQSEDRSFEVVDVPEWGPGAQVRVSSLSGSERDTFEASITTRRGTEVSVNLVNARAKLVVLTIVDDEGNRVFTDDDVFEVGKKNATALNRIFEVAQRLSGLTEDDVKEAVAGFAPDPAEGSSSV